MSRAWSFQPTTPPSRGLNYATVNRGGYHVYSYMISHEIELEVRLSKTVGTALQAL